MKRLKVGLMGLAGVGLEYLAALRSDDQFELIAVADSDPEVLRQHTETVSARVYEDYRSLVVETAHTGLDLLFVALEPFQSVEFALMAAARGIGVFHKAPFARHVREARRLAGRFAQHGCPLVVSRFWQFEPAFSRLKNLSELCGHVYAAVADVRTVDTPTGWRCDLAQAGGGVLLNGAYDAVDLIVHLLGLPGSVYAQCGVAAGPRAPRKYDTEDVATVSLRFSKEQIACITAVRGAAEPSWLVTIRGTDRTVELCGERMTVTPCDGGSPEQHRVWARHPVSCAISAFGAARRLEEGGFASTADEHLATIAVIETAYLSAKTGEPESPGRLLG